MKTQRSQGLVLILIGCVIAMLYGTSNSFSQETTIKLPTTDDTSSFNVTAGNDATVLKAEANGNVDISGTMTATTYVGDGSNLANVRPVAAYSGGNFDMELTSTEQVVKYVQFTVPAQGIIIVNVSGYARWGSTDDDVYRLSITTGTSHDYSCLMLATDYACPDSSDQYTSISLTRGYTVGSGGTYRYNLIGDNPTFASGFGNSIVRLGDINMTAMYFPTGGTNPTKPVIINEQSEPVSPGPGIDTPNF